MNESREPKADDCGKVYYDDGEAWTVKEKTITIETNGGLTAKCKKYVWVRVPELDEVYGGSAIVGNLRRRRPIDSN